MAEGRRWADLSTVQRTAVVVGAALELGLTATAAIDLSRRPAEQIRGPKPVWWLAIVVQPVGSIAYLTWGRRARG